MSENEQRKAIAKHFGWHSFRSVEGGALFGYPKGTPCNGRTPDVCPDWLNSRDVMHEVENGLTDEQFREYSEYLCDLCGVGSPRDNPNLDYLEIRPLISATAAQRAEAFLRCLGKWTESTPDESKV